MNPSLDCQGIIFRGLVPWRVQNTRCEQRDRHGETHDYDEYDEEGTERRDISIARTCLLLAFVFQFLWIVRDIILDLIL